MYNHRVSVEIEEAAKLVNMDATVNMANQYFNSTLINCCYKRFPSIDYFVTRGWQDVFGTGQQVEKTENFTPKHDQGSLLWNFVECGRGKWKHLISNTHCTVQWQGSVDFDCFSSEQACACAYGLLLLMSVRILSFTIWLLHDMVLYYVFLKFSSFLSVIYQPAF